MAFTRQILSGWLMAGLFLVSAAMIFVRPRWEWKMGNHALMRPTIDCSWNFSGREYGILQVDEGAWLPADRARLRRMPPGMADALSFRRQVEPGVSYREPYKTGARRTVAAVFVNGQGHMLPMRIDGMLLGFGLGMMGVTAWVAVEVKRRIAGGPGGGRAPAVM